MRFIWFYDIVHPQPIRDLTKSKTYPDAVSSCAFLELGFHHFGLFGTVVGGQEWVHNWNQKFQDIIQDFFLNHLDHS